MMANSSSGTAAVQADLEDYLSKKTINAIFVDIVEELLLNKPDNPVEFMVKHLMEKYPDETKDIFPKNDTPPKVVQIEASITDDEISETDSETSSHDDDDDGAHHHHKPHRPPPNKRRASVCAEKLCEVTMGQSEIKVVPKTSQEMSHIGDILTKNVLFQHLDDDQIKTVQNAMFLVEKEEGDVIIQQGEEGDNFYIVDSGSVDVFIESPAAAVVAAKKVLEDEATTTPSDNNKDDAPLSDRKHVASYQPGDSFGELAIMYNAPRAATCISNSPCRLWALDRVSFKIILMQTTVSRRNVYKGFLEQVPILSQLTEYEVLTIADSLNEEMFNDGDVICNQGDEGDKFYIVKEGEAVCTQQIAGQLGGENKEVARLKTGSYFGEIALVTTKPRQATVTAAGTLRCLALDRKTFKRVMGPIQNILMRNMEEYNKFQATII